MRMTTDTVLINHVAGRAWLQTPNDGQVALRAGMRMPADARIVTGADAKVMLQAEGAAPVVVGQDADVVIAAEVAETRARAPESEPASMEAGESVADQVLALLDAGEDPFAVLDPAAAVLTGGGGGGTDVTRLSSVTETTAPLSLDFPAPGAAALEAVPLTGGGAGAIGPDSLAPGPGQPDLPDQPGEPDQPDLPGPTIEIADMNDDGPDYVLPGTLSIEENNTEEGVSGWLAVTAPAGLSHLVFDVTGADGAPASQIVSLDALLGASSDAPVVIDTDRGQLLITGYDRDSGRVDYTYRSDGPQDHGPATDGESVFDRIGITVVDDEGRTASSDLVANILDTVPRPVDDHDTITDGEQTTISGNILDNDAHSGDPVTITGARADGGDEPVGDNLSPMPPGGELVLFGSYGDLTIHADGTYTYTLAGEGDPRYAALRALGEGDEAKEDFAYRVTDSDGDSALGSITISVVGANNAPTPSFGGRDGHAAVSEEGLTSNDVNNGLTDNGNLHGAGGDADPHADRAAPAPGDMAHDTVLAAAFAAGTDAAPRVDDHPPHPVGPISLAGSPGDDVFVWTFADRGAGQAPAADHIADFGMGGGDPNGQDRIDLSELLSDRAEGEDLTHYLQISGDGHQTVINVSTTGHVDTGHDRQIIIDNVDLTAGHGSDQADLINSLIQQGKLQVDSNG